MFYEINDALWQDVVINAQLESTKGGTYNKWRNIVQARTLQEAWKYSTHKRKGLPAHVWW